MKIVAVTACVTGVAHTYMAAAALAKAAKTAGFDLKVETQGSLGVENELTAEEIAAADVVILAVDTCIQNSDRFDGKVIFEAPVAAAIKDSGKLIADALKSAGINES